MLNYTFPGKDPSVDKLTRIYNWLKIFFSFFIPTLVISLESFFTNKYDWEAVMVAVVLGTVCILLVRIHWIPKIILLILYIPTILVLSIYYSFAFTAAVFGDFL